MTDRTVAPRAVQRLLGRAIDDIGQAERCCAGRSCREFAVDPIRRDAVEQCLRRVSAIASQLTGVDGGVRVQLEPILHVLRPLCIPQLVDRMDSDVLYGLVDLCSNQLRPEIDRLLRRRPSPAG